MRTLLTIVAVALLLASCCAGGRPVRLHTLVAQTPGPLLVVYHPEHATWNTPLMRATILIDGEPVGALCEGQMLAVPLAPGAHLLSTSRDDELGCSMATSRPEGGWPPLAIEVTDGPIYLRYGADPYLGPDTEASICERHLTLVDGASARHEAPRPELIEP